MENKVKIGIKNYRCFGHEPQFFEIGEGFSALVGVNNSGKSAVLKMFYELRHVWGVLSSAGHLGILSGSDQRQSGLLGVNDVDEIFNHHTQSNTIELIFTIPNTENDDIFEFTLRITKHGNNGVSLKGMNCSINKIPTTFKNSSSNSGGVISFVYIQETESGQRQARYPVNFIADFFQNLHSSIYIPSFRNAINVGENRSHYDVAIGTAFIKQWNDWKVGDQKVSRDKITKITEDIRDLFGYKSLEINASQNQDTLRLTIDGKSYSLLEVGSGISQFILAFATVAVKNPSFIFIDEPELNLHPALQLKFLSSLGSYAKSGVLFGSHSIGLTRSIAERIFSVTNNGTEAKIKKLEDTPNYSVLLGELSYSAYQEIGADSILFVEGVTEVRVFQELLRKFNKDSKVLVMSLGGSEMINGKRGQELSEITTRINVKKLYAWVDSEKQSTKDNLPKDRADFEEVCKKLKINCSISERRAIENYFTEDAIRKAFADKNKKELGEFGKPEAEANWSKKENWKVAREMSKTDLSKSDLGKFISSLK